MSEPIYITKEGYENLKIELENLIGKERQELAERLRVAIQQGDLSENADYQIAKEDQGFLEGRILEIEYILKNATIIEQKNGKKGVVEIGTTVTIQEEDYPPEAFMLVGAKEADPQNGRISNESPIGKAIINHRVGDVVTANTPGGAIRIRILKIE